MADCRGGRVLPGTTENSDGSFSAAGIPDAVKRRKDFRNTVSNRKKDRISLPAEDDATILQLNGRNIETKRYPAVRTEEGGAHALQQGLPASPDS